MNVRIDRVKRLNEDIEYGIIHIKSIKMIIINNVVTREDTPFKLNDIVGDSWVIITSIIGTSVEL